MSLLSRQRRLCEELALKASTEREEFDDARAELARSLRREISKPLALVAFFAAGLLVGRLVLRERDRSDEHEDGEEPRSTRARRVTSLGLSLLRVLRTLGVI
jgi:hypothetical protein